MTDGALTRCTRPCSNPGVRGIAARWRLHSVGMILSLLSRPQPTGPEAPVQENLVSGDTVHRAERRSELPVPPAVSALVLSAAGLLLVATAYWVGPFGASWKPILYFAGQLTIFLPSAYWLLISSTPTRSDRLWLVVVLFGALTVAKLLYSPLEFKYGDELQHWRTASDVLASGHLFHGNFALPVSPRYPGLESVTAAVASLSGLSVFAAGVLVIAAARLLMALATFLLFERAARSSVVAGAASLFYVANAHFQFFDAMFVYEAFALPCAALVIVVVARPWSGGRATYLAWAAVSTVCVFVVIVSHHVTAWLFAAFLLLWAPIAALRPKRDPRPAAMALLTLAGIALWLKYVAPLTPGYATRPLLKTLSEFGHPSYAGATSAGGGAKPLFDQFFTAAALVAITLGVALGSTLAWRKYRGASLALALAASSLAYYGVVAFRFMPPDGAEISGRLMPFVFVAVAFVLAVALGWPKLPRLLKGMYAPGVLVIGAIIFLGGLASSWPPWWERLPGPYQAAAFERSIDPQSVQAAKWAGVWLRHTPAGTYAAADMTNAGLLTTYGDLNISYDVAPLFYAPTWGPAQRTFMVAHHIRYIVVDRRLSRYRPVGAVSYFRGAQSDRLPTPIPVGSLTKFDRVPGALRIYDSGDIVIYDMKGALNAP